MQTIIIVADVSSKISRKFLEDIEGSVFENEADLRRFIETATEEKEFYTSNLSDFMDDSNNDDMALSESWVGYVYCKKGA